MNRLANLQKAISLRQAMLQGQGVVGGARRMTRRKTTRARTTNPWLQHVKAFRAKHPNMPYSECLKRARATYKPKGAGVVGGRRKRMKRAMGGRKRVVRTRSMPVRRRRM